MALHWVLLCLDNYFDDYRVDDDGDDCAAAASNDDDNVEFQFYFECHWC